MNETGDDQGKQKYFRMKTLYKVILRYYMTKKIVEFLYFIEGYADAYTVNPIVLDATTTESVTQSPLAEENLQSGIY